MLSVAIQAGGQSKRMGRDKALVPLGGKPLIEHVLDRVRNLGDEVLITSNRPDTLAYLGLPIHGDPNPGAGALAGLHTALEAASGKYVLVIACDMPFVEPALLQHMIQLSSQFEIVIPSMGGRYEPLLAIYARSLLPRIEATLAQGEMRMISFYSQAQMRHVYEDEIKRFDPEMRSFFNINTPQDLARAEGMLPAARS